MKKMFQSILGRINLIDICLILFMIILMLQSAYTLLAGSAGNQEQNTIDIIVRTSAASIFGYFISGNFLCKEDSKKKVQKRSVEATSVSKENALQQDNSKDNEIYLDVTVESQSSESGCKNLQIIITTGIGLFSLIMILLFRNFCKPTIYSGVTLSQFRDFVSGCVGFLLGSTKGK